MPQTTVLLANSELAAVAWIKTIPGFTADVVSTTLPGNESEWISNGAVQVSVVGGAPSPNGAFHNVVIQADCFANNAGSDKPPWDKAITLATQIYLGCLDRKRAQRTVPILKSGVPYPPVTVRTAYAMTEPRRLPGDPGDYAIFSLDIALTWSQDGQVTP